MIMMNGICEGLVYKFKCFWFKYWLIEANWI